MSPEERAARINSHKIHTIALLTSAGIRNRWACNQLLQARLLSLVPLPIQNGFTMIHKKRVPDVAKRGRLFEAAISRLCEWWVETFDVRDGVGIKNRTFDQVRNGALDRDKGEVLRSEKSLMKHALLQAGSRDVSAQLFTATCRALGIPARLIFSVQAVPWQASVGKKPVPKKDKKDKGKAMTTASDDDNPVAGPSTQPTVRLRKPRAKGRKLNEGVPQPPLAGWPPVFWTEVFSRPDGRWLPADPIRNLVNKKKLFEPPRNDPNNRMTYVVAYEEDGFVRDVTARYASAYATKTTKSRGSGRSHKEWWDRVLQPLTRPYRLHRDDVEDDELTAALLGEGMPNSVGGFKDHPVYVLERHLHRDEVVHPRIEVGKFRGDPVFSRANVISLKTSENWMRQGRCVRAGEQPLKHVPLRAVTINRRREIEQARENGGEEPTQGIYGFAQTEVYVPPAVTDGKIPKNDFNNIDLYVPSMLPAGAVHITHKGTAKIARQLGVDFAEAVTGFEFKKRKANPIITGIVVASENEDAVLEAYWASVADSEEKERAKRQDRVLKRWTRLVHGLRIRERLLKQYGNPDDLTDDVPKGGFVSQLNSTIQHFSLPKSQHPVIE
ncbi:Rad4-domain-containing protein, partial [Auriculariales sp. MPI-PUGE-AT-0066]